MTVASDPRTAARLGLIDAFRTTGRTSWVEATGRSMYPSIPPGSGLLVEFGRLPERRGEVIVFRRGETLVAHRLVARHGDRSIARGDGEAFADPPLDEGDILGVVRVVRRPDGRTDDLVGTGRRDGVIAMVSWWSGRAAGVGARVLRRLPLIPTARRAAMSGLVGLSRVPTRVVSEALPRSRRGQARGRR